MFGNNLYFKKRKQILFFSLLALVFNGVSYLFLKAWSGFAMVGVAILRNIIFIIQNKKDNSEKLTLTDWIILIVLYIISIISAIFTYDGIFSLLSVLATMIYTYSVWQKNVKVYKIMGICASITWIAYGVFIKSIFAIILESVLLIIEIIGTIRENTKCISNNGDENGKG